MYLVDGGKKHFLSKGATRDDLMVPKTNIVRWINQMSLPKPSKGAELHIEDRQGTVIATSLYGASRLRWVDRHGVPA